MARHSLAAAAALIALAVASPVTAKGRPAHSPPVRAAQPQLPAPSYAELQSKVEELTQTIADLSDRLTALEDAIGAPDDQDDELDDGVDDGFVLAHARGADGAHRPHRTLRSRQGHRRSPHSRGPAAGMAPAA
ncbi:MAG TPA: hypothetical protein VLM18_01175 [Croceibacterium sp.]|nr:hypothetical protein [Croceibacterium sp.]